MQIEEINTFIDGASYIVAATHEQQEYYNGEAQVVRCCSHLTGDQQGYRQLKESKARCDLSSRKRLAI